jgi:hypothetical protein
MHYLLGCVFHHKQMEKICSQIQQNYYHKNNGRIAKAGKLFVPVLAVYAVISGIL